jgi:hypothetical protein
MAALLNTAFTGDFPQTQYAANDVQSTPKVAVQETTLHKLAHHAAHTLATLSPIARAEAAMPQRRATDRWSIQVGAYKQQGAAARANVTALAHLPTAEGVAIVVSTRTSRGPTFQARIVNLTEKQAGNACRVLRRAHKDCAVLGPSLQMAAVHGPVKSLAE